MVRVWCIFNIINIRLMLMRKMVSIKTNIFVLVVVCVAVNSIAERASEKILLSVFYESNCPDSKKFILQQLQPAMRMLHDYVKLQFVPFGKSRSINYGDNGFECQHGSSECLGNIVQDCALFLMKDRSQREHLKYVVCEMATEAGSRGDLKCTGEANLKDDQVEECVLKGKGTILQLESEHFTSLVRPSFVPTITINGVFDQEIQDYAQVDLFGAVCSVAPEIPPCAHHYNSLALRYVMQKPAKTIHIYRRGLCPAVNFQRLEALVFR